MKDFEGQHILLGITGGIAAYKSTYLVRALTQLGAVVRVVMTESATAFVTPMTFQALSGFPVRTALFDEAAERAMGHIELARFADYLVIAPASANCIAKMAHGLADDLLSTLTLVAECPVIVCPAMNHSMWKHPATQANCALLKERGVLIVGPSEGIQACQEYGYGRVSEPEEIIHALRLYGVKDCLKGESVVITAGPTREALDPVRYLSNRSSGKMGYALAQAAHTAGAKVTLVTGPTDLAFPTGVDVKQVESAQAMHACVMASLKPGDIFIGTAAVADYRVEAIAAHKLKKGQQTRRSLDLLENDDILADVVKTGRASYVVGFAAETCDVLKHAREKLSRKNVDMLVANDVSGGRGFDSDENQVTVLTRDHEETLPSMHKMRLAGQLIIKIASCLQGASAKHQH
ncbi:MAG: bifunctional phosphopantothenoylcysteine decarboxylase/phosphopantothenate--cysteine ligase CoaBC [Legionellaceae bacterium]